MAPFGPSSSSSVSTLFDSILRLKAALCTAQEGLRLRFAFYLGKARLLDGHSQEESPPAISNGYT